MFNNIYIDNATFIMLTIPMHKITKAAIVAALIKEILLTEWINNISAGITKLVLFLNSNTVFSYITFNKIVWQEVLTYIRKISDVDNMIK